MSVAVLFCARKQRLNGLIVRFLHFFQECGLFLLDSVLALLKGHLRAAEPERTKTCCVLTQLALCRISSTKHHRENSPLGFIVSNWFHRFQLVGRCTKKQTKRTVCL